MYLLVATLSLISGVVNTPLWLGLTAALACFAFGVVLGYWFDLFRLKKTEGWKILAGQNTPAPVGRQVELQRAMLLVLQDAASECVQHAIAVTKNLASQVQGREPGSKAVVMEMKYLSETTAIQNRISKLRDKVADPAVRRLAEQLTDQSRKTLRCNSVADAKDVLKEVAICFDLLNQAIARSLQSLDQRAAAS